MEAIRSTVYTRMVPVLLPWVPLYTLKNIRVYFE